MKYRFLGHSDRNLLGIKHNEIHSLVVTTSFWSHKPRIVKPFYRPYKSWKAFYQEWRPITMDTIRLEHRAIDNEIKTS